MEILKQSPVSFQAQPVKTEERNSWPVVLEYEGESSGQYLVDLCHLVRLDLQSSDLSQFKPGNVEVPTQAGVSNLTADVLINRMNGTQSTIWQIGQNSDVTADDSAYTDVTEATVALAIIGENSFDIAERLSNLDFLDPTKKAPFLLQGPFSHVPCQVTALSKEKGFEGFLITCSRGYANAMVHALFDAGGEFNLQPAGESRFSAWISQITS